MIIHEDITQGSEAWERIRLGRATASQAVNILTPTGKLSTSRTKFARKLARECYVADPFEFQGNKFTDWGNDHEVEARSVFMELTGEHVHEVGFVTREDGIIGCSPDGLIKDDDGDWVAGLEIKCPTPDKHVEYYLNNQLPPEYKMQVHWSLAVTGLAHWWFMSYFPGAKAFVYMVEADEFTGKVKQAQDDFLIDYKNEYALVADIFKQSDE